MKKLLVGGAGIAAGLGLASAGAAAYVAKMVQGRATGDIDGFLDSSHSGDRDVVVCLGASIVRGRASVDFVDMLRSRAPQLEFVNGGVNNDTSDDILQRLDSVIACHPSKIIILVGTSDAQAILNPESAATKKKQKETGNHDALTVDGYRRNLQATVTELVERTGARVGLCSLPPLGQAIDSPPNDVIRELNAAIKDVAESTGEVYLPVYERMVEYLAAANATDGKPFTGDWRIGARSLSQHFIVGRSYDVIAEREGLLLSPDYVHLNTAGASIVADVCQEFVSAEPAPVVETAEPAPVVSHAASPDPEVIAEAATPEAAAVVSEPAPEPSAAAEVAQPADESVPAPRPATPTPFEPVATIEPESARTAKGDPSPYGA